MVRGVDDAFCGVGMEVSRKRLMVLKLLRKRDPRGWREIVDLARVASVSVFSFFRRLGCVHQYELQCTDVICVDMCSFLWRGTSVCLIMFSRSRPGIIFISVVGVRLYR